MLPVVAFLVVNNWYAKNIVRDKVSETYQNTLNMFVSQTDRSLMEVDDYLKKLAVLDSDVGLLMSFPYRSDNYVLTKIRILNKLNRDIGFYKPINTVFLFHESDIIFSTSDPYTSTMQVLKNNASLIVGNQQPAELSQWMLWEDDLIPGRDFLVKVFLVTDGLYVGAIIDISDLLELLSIQWDYGDIGESAIYRHNGTRLAESLANPNPKVPLNNLVLLNKPYQIITNKSDNKPYMVIERSSKIADMTVSITIPESYMLQGLPYFQKATYFMALGFIVVLILYLLFIRQMIFNPLQQLIKGMKKLSLGILDVRLHTNETIEFVFLANTFNNMAQQIEVLKIGMYEEQIRAQRMELKQLQAQINPHFYMNSLNIIYNFAALKDYDSVKKMSLHLADYFRFIMRINRDSITLGEELKHIESYMEIQKFRFPNKLSCVFDIPQPLNSVLLPALSLQPFVENAIIHGFVNRKEPFTIQLSGHVSYEGEQRFVCIAIEDNGIGFPGDVLEKLNGDGMLPQAKTSSRLGILNVIQRLNLRYEGDAEVTFGNRESDGGAAVRIKLPLQSADS
ncbi:sensor histidine kinase [Paenibacillus nasutitermitis]|uniref:Sensor histidine kinase YesM n=1 Tax=Paenibacillus nasutitermitis TaxID=1652958 RepID=A0A916ZK37_9BACL|nr:histidine kinase [Paenibacillus nasutitermitis]GGE01490.1 sensor histidine kinase YesM [Paenibacillus nasutitermitis]